jgi:methionyl-tRNA formyltransferase
VKSAYDFIRGLSPYPAAWTTLRTSDGKETQLKVFFSEKDLENEKIKMKNEKCSGLAVALSDGDLYLTDVQLAGKKRMPVADFLRGAHLEGAVLVESGVETPIPLRISE